MYQNLGCWWGHLQTAAVTCCTAQVAAETHTRTTFPLDHVLHKTAPHFLLPSAIPPSKNVVELPVRRLPPPAPLPQLRPLAPLTVHPPRRRPGRPRSTGSPCRP
jgi:hypothetical protein